ncbi:MAG: galactose mutarotase [Bacteroidales bacterium]|nr:galactose mutarotase [Bacteroidales bacterium]MCM1414948.1 galactose mutarotase [bacterium]MCM1424794.1 galactose mutarotase [bacterium]
MGIVTEKFGTAKTGEEVFLYTLKNKNGVEAKITNFGAALVNLYVPDKDGKPEDVVLGFDTLEGYFGNGSFFGVTVGPSANRIAGASFSLNGKTYQLPVNDGENNLHSDKDNGYHKRVWAAVAGENELTLTLEGKDGEMGFPGNKKITMTYSLSEDNGLKLKYHAVSDADTIINLTNHTYFNLAGHKSGNIEGQLLRLYASSFTYVLPGAIPTGENKPVAGTPLDFTQMKAIGKDIGADCEQLKLVQGYDHNFVVDGYDGKMRLIAEAADEKSGRRMKVFSDLPGVQFYAGNCIAPEDGKDGAHYEARSGFCLETQYYPDNIHHPNFPQSVFGPGKDFDAETIYQFV